MFIPPNSILDPLLASDSRLRREFEREPSLVEFHICRKRILSSDMNNNDLIETMTDDDKLRVSKRLHGVGVCE